MNVRQSLTAGAMPSRPGSPIQKPFGTVWRVVAVLAVLASALSAGAQTATDPGTSGQEAAADADRNRPERLQWLQDAGFGMFVHWSVDSQLGSVISHSMVGASEEYLNWYIRELPKTFNPKRWDPDELAALAKLSGMKYVVLTTKHHNGFCLWDTKTTDFNIMRTPYGRDILADYVQAVRRHGLAVGFYFSPEDFHWLHRHGFTVRRRGGERPDADTNDEYGRFIRAQVTELFSLYGPVDVLFIDGEGEQVTKDVAWSLQPECLITRGAIATPEQYVPGVAPKGAWESCITMGTQWQYKPTNEQYKSGSRLIELLIETRAKGGALLLNVGPKPNGELPIEQEERLREIALWHAVNGQAIHNSRPWIVTNEGDIWFTRDKQADTVYAMLSRIPDWPRGQRRDFLLQSVQATEGSRVSVLGHAGQVVEYSPHTDATPRLAQTAEGLRVSVVRAQRLYNDHKWPNPVVLRLENVQPAFERPPAIETLKATSEGDGRVKLHGRLLDLADAPQVEVAFEYQPYSGFATATHNTLWTATDFSPRDRAGEFLVVVEGLEPGATYQYRAVVRHPKITLRGDHLRVTAK